MGDFSNDEVFTLPSRWVLSLEAFTCISRCLTSLVLVPLKISSLCSWVYQFDDAVGNPVSPKWHPRTVGMFFPSLFW